MSLKAFHILFLISAIVLCLGFGTWEIREFLRYRGWLDLGIGVFSLGSGAALIVYFRVMLKKLRGISYL